MIYEPNYAGSIALHRKIMQSPVFKNPELYQLWSWCLLSASYKKRTVMVDIGGKKHGVTLKPGQLIYGRRSTAEALGANPSTTRHRLKKLEAMGLIKIFSKGSYSIIYITKWSIYQSTGKRHFTGVDDDVSQDPEIDSYEFNGEVITFQRNK